ncbi:hypothetical protein [Nocardia neocaledoniensis]|uniref:hypothetical protein n=1 Tax=Nocardia neocaledoniensis TaxID=236511 RepID=UPI00245658D1|nr:hypothetical protein [Nocardia neocaledoniensis]
MDERAWNVGAAVDAVLSGGTGAGGVDADQVAAVLRLLEEHRERVDRVEVAFLDAVLARGWTWEQLGAAMGKRSKQAAQQHAKRLRARLSAPSDAMPRAADSPVSDVVETAPSRVASPSSSVPVVEATLAAPQHEDLPVQALPREVAEPAEAVVAVTWRDRGRSRGAPYTGPTRFDRTVPATSCPTCGFDPAGQSLRGRLREDLKVTWLEGAADGVLVERAHCERCQPRAPRHRIADLSCVECGEGPLLVDALAAAYADESRIEAPVGAWLAAHGWREAPQGLTCGDHD